MSTHCQSGTEAVERWKSLWEVLGLWGRDAVLTHPESVTLVKESVVPNMGSWKYQVYLWQMVPKKMEPGRLYVAPGVVIGNYVRVTEEEADVLKTLLLGDERS